MKRTVWLAAVLAASTAAAADQACLEMVFDRFCLGGDSHTLAEVEPLIRVDGEKHYFRVADDLVMTEVDRDRIVSVIRILSSPGHRTFNNHVERFTARYGQPQEHGSLPTYANNGQALEVAVNARKGHVDRVWNRGDWTVRLIWTELGMGLAYLVENQAGRP